MSLKNNDASGNRGVSQTMSQEMTQSIERSSEQQTTQSSEQVVCLNYFVTGLETIEMERSGFVFVGDVYCCGYFTTLDEAIATIEANGKEIIERGYQYVVIEGLYPGYQMRPRLRYLYKWCKDTQKFISVPEPDGFRDSTSIYCF